jgi:hypothetical protein
MAFNVLSRPTRVAGVLCMLLALPGPALAQPAPSAGVAPAAQDAEALALKKEGNEQFEKFNVGRALELYEQALKVVVSEELKTILLYNKTQALQKLGNNVSALETAELFKSKATPALSEKVNIEKVLSELRAAVCTVEVVVSQAGARISVDNVVRVTSSLQGPNIFNVERKQYKVLVELDGYESLEQNLDAQAAKAAPVVATLKSKLKTGVVIVQAPADAVISVDDVELGAPPARRELGAGSHVLSAKRPGTGTAKKSVILKVGATIDASFTESDFPGPSVTSRWWFWTGIGVLVVGGAVAITVVALNTERSPDKGSLNPNLVRTAGFRF